ncbi:MAG: bifunctional 5,10-methylenetetrahydrofolate dehydrogenase/5,10-methenyltetrahydrofolate cyclohydrolase [Peptostreptococcaceae bacterium]
MKLLKGKLVADKITEELKNEVLKLEKKSKLAVIRVGNNYDDISYEKGALKRCETIGIETKSVILDENISTDDYLSELELLNNDDSVSGILALRPLPNHLDENIIKHRINPLKDVDCFNPINVSKLIEGDESGFIPCTASAVIEILKHNNIKIEGSNICVLGRSMIVGKPVSMLLLNENATVTTAHSRTKNLKEVTKNCDILVVAVGQAKMIDSSYIKEGCIVIDVGINVDDEGKLCGDVDTLDVIDKVRYITPVPMGVGSVTTSILSKQVIKAYNNYK